MAEQEFIDVGGIVLDAALLAVPRARAAAAVLVRGVSDYARLLECRRRNDGKEEVLVVEVEVQRPQAAVHDVRATERVALVFTADDRTPEVLSLRPDFPQVPHLNLTGSEFPKSLCLYEQAWAEVKSGWTPARFVERVRHWFAETAKGTLHQDDQPLEPLIAGAGMDLIVPHDLFEGDGGGGHRRLMITLPDGEKGRVLVARRPTGQEQAGMPYVAVALRAEALTHGVIRSAPGSLAELHQFLTAAGLDLLGSLRGSQDLWAVKEHLKAKLVVIVACPKRRGDRTVIEATDVWAFLTPKSVAEVLTGIGRRAAGGGYILGAPKEDEGGQSIPLWVLRTSYNLARHSAGYFNGYDRAVDRKVVAVGLGALGSKVQLSLARSGFGLWTLVDDDVLFPHNLARHQYTGFWTGRQKVAAAQAATESLFDESPTPAAIAANVLSPGEDGAALDRALAEADLILDMSASVPVARHLAAFANSKARRVSVFLNPSATALVLLAEDAGRTVTLDALEFQFNRAVLNDGRLADHYAVPGGRVRYAASCRDITGRIPDDQVSALAAVAARAVRRAAEDPAAQIRVWKLTPGTFDVTSFSVEVAAVHRRPFGSWSLVLDDELIARLREIRQAKLPNETGGVLLGSFDHSSNTAYVADTLPSPPDSKEWPTLYVRGSDMLAGEVARVRERTASQVEYVGEWHSHPTGYGSNPSEDDVKVFAWLTEHMDDEGLPALMGIVGEGGPRFFLGEIVRGGG